MAALSEVEASAAVAACPWYPKESLASGELHASRALAFGTISDFAER